MAALLAVGLVVGLLIAIPWVSPLAAGLPGLALLALTGLYLASVRHAVHLIPLKTHIYGQGFEAMLFNGVLALVGLAMVIPLFVPSRWRRRTVSSGRPGRPLDRAAERRFRGATQQGTPSSRRRTSTPPRRSSTTRSPRPTAARSARAATLPRRPLPARRRRTRSRSDRDGNGFCLARREQIAPGSAEQVTPL